MKYGSWIVRLPLPFVAFGLLLVIGGCGQSGQDTESTGVSEASPAEHGDEEHEQGEEGHDLHGYWCVEHGVPEAICARCDTKLAAEFQKKGDWCEEHNRPDSQCFICHPELQEKFVAQYEAKFGEKPPAPDPE